jgi:hypothetical protein
VQHPDRQDQRSAAPRANGGRRAAWLILMALLLAIVAFPLPAMAAGGVTDIQIQSGKIRPADGAAVITGTVTCAEATPATVYVTVRQGNGQRLIEAAGGKELTCGPTPTKFRIAAKPTGDSGKPHGGRAFVNVFVDCGPGCFLGQDKTLRLKGGQG